MVDIKVITANEILGMVEQCRSLIDDRLDYETMLDHDSVSEPVSMEYCPGDGVSTSNHFRCWVDIDNATRSDSEAGVIPANTINVTITHGDDLMDFGKALNILKNGGRVARKGWIGEGKWLALTKGSTIPKDLARSGAVLKLAEEGVDEITINDHIDMRTADGSICCGWTASQADMLSEDWLQAISVRDRRYTTYQSPGATVDSIYFDNID